MSTEVIVAVVFRHDDNFRWFCILPPFFAQLLLSNGVH